MTGSRIVRPCSASAREIACLIHQVAYVESLKPMRVVELLDRADEPEVALLDEVEQRARPARVVARDRHHEPQVRLDQLPLRGLVAGVLAARELALLRRREQARRRRSAGRRASAGRRHSVPASPGSLRGVAGSSATAGLLVVRRVEEMLGGIAFHGVCIGRAVAPLEG